MNLRSADSDFFRKALELCEFAACQRDYGDVDFQKIRELIDKILNKTLPYIELLKNRKCSRKRRKPTYRGGSRI